MHSRMETVGYLNSAVAFVAWEGTHLVQYCHASWWHVTGFDTIDLLASWTLKIALLTINKSYDPFVNLVTHILYG